MIAFPDETCDIAIAKTRRWNHQPFKQRDSRSETHVEAYQAVSNLFIRFKKSKNPDTWEGYSWRWKTIFKGDVYQRYRRLQEASNPVWAEITLKFTYFHFRYGSIELGLRLPKVLRPVFPRITILHVIWRMPWVFGWCTWLNFSSLKSRRSLSFSIPLFW
jgi:hypothetical protein